jgi:hypothetical protein
MSRPAAIVHADWSKNPRKRWMARGEWKTGAWHLEGPDPVPEKGWLDSLREEADRLDGALVVGVDFPIGVPSAYAEKAGIVSFRDLLARIAEDGAWSEFHEVAEKEGQISCTRPFYPHRPGGSRLEHLVEGLGLQGRDDLLRRCERAHKRRPAASPLFWTLGAKQVGKGALTGWTEIVEPAAAEPAARLWPFDGVFEELCAERGLVVVETYPAEFYHQLGFPRSRWSKRRQSDRIECGARLLEWVSHARGHRVWLGDRLRECIEHGFGPRPDGEDAFDAVVGLIGMVKAIITSGPVPVPAPSSRGDGFLAVEGWIFGQDAS